MRDNRSSVRPLRSVRCHLAAVLAVATALAGACSKTIDEAPPPATPVADHGDGIPWFGGTVEEAFALAKVERRPVFLYWGAVWCPPCHVLRTRLFPRPEFRARLAATVPVYLDGDTERAQIWGEKLGAAGYPTVMVFDPDGREVTRINSLISIDRYVETLTAALDATRPVAELVETVRSDGAGALSEADLNLLAFYSWYQDQATGLDLAGRRALFDRLRRETPERLPIERARFTMLYLGEAADEEEGTPPAELAESERAELVADVRGVLADRERRNANLDVVLYGAGSADWLAPEGDADRTALFSEWDAALRAVEGDESLAAGERSAALFGALRLARAASGAGDAFEPDEALRERIRTRVRWAAETVTDEDELQGVLNTVAGVLETAGMADEAKSLLQASIDRTLAPYYYTGWLASLEEDEGRAEEAVRLYREAWQGARASGSEGGMTPMRWGATYLRKVAALTPEASEAIAADGATILDDVLANDDAFALGNWSRLQTIDDALSEWAGDDPGRGSVLSGLRERVGSRCADFPDEGDDSAAARCRSLASGEAVT